MLSRVVIKWHSCSLPVSLLTQVSTNVFVGAYIDRILERQLSDGTNAHGDDTGHNNKQATGKKSKHLDALISFDDFVHVFWVFSSLASRSDKEEGEHVCPFVRHRSFVAKRFEAVTGQLGSEELVKT